MDESSVVVTERDAWCEARRWKRARPEGMEVWR